jgi:X-linked retinitis pigmentosa GTPase regulator
LLGRVREGRGEGRGERGGEEERKRGGEEERRRGGEEERRRGGEEKRRERRNAVRKHTGQFRIRGSCQKKTEPRLFSLDQVCPPQKPSNHPRTPLRMGRKKRKRKDSGVQGNQRRAEKGHSEKEDSK